MSELADPKELRLRYAGKCRGCAVLLAKGSWAFYDSEAKQVICPSCFHLGFASGGKEIPTDAVAPLLITLGLSHRSAVW